MELIRAASRRSIFSETTYIILNLALAVALFIVVIAFETPWPAFILVLVSKWRILAVRPRFWFANIQTNLVDIMVGLSAAILMWQASGAVVLQGVIAALFAAWLLILKPKSKRKAMLIQAGVAQFAAITAVYSIAFGWPAFAVVICMWLIGYATARHVLSSYEEEEITQLSLIWGFVTAEMGWVAYHWTMAYAPFANLVELQIPQIAIIMLGLSYIAERAYALYRRDGHISFQKIKWQLLFVALLLLMILTLFNGYDVGEF